MANAIRFYETGGPDVLRYEEVAVGEPGPGQVRLRHAAVGLNYADTYFRNGTYPIPMPNGLGVEGAGVVEAVGRYLIRYMNAANGRLPLKENWQSLPQQHVLWHTRNEHR